MKRKWIKVETKNILKIVVVVGVSYTLATVISMDFEQHTAMAYFTAGIFSGVVGMAIDNDA